MKKGFEINTTSDIGRKIEPTLVVGSFAGYSAGTVLDANAVVQLVIKILNGAVSGGEILPDTVGSEQIIDGSIRLEDLSSEITSSLNSNYNPNNETLYTNNIIFV